MKKLIVAIVMLMLAEAVNVSADSQKDQLKERKELAKATKKELNEKASKAARKEAKQLSKEGWKAAPGALPLEKQLDRSYMMQYEFDMDGFPKYIMGEGMSTGGNYDAAKMQALELAKQDLAGKIQTEVTALIDNTIANQQGDDGEVSSLTRSVMASKNLISQSIGRVIPVVAAYRDVSGKKKEVRVLVAYSMDMAKATTKKAIRKDLEQRGDSLHARLDQLLGW